jgi:hypothetical protein
VLALCAVHPRWRGSSSKCRVADSSRRKSLDRVIAGKMMIFGSDFPWPGLGKIARDGAGYALTVRTT